MSPEFRIEQKIREFQHAVGIPEYNNVIEKLLKKAADNNIKVFFWNQGYSSVRDQEPDGICYIRIDNNPASGNRKEIVFNMMHEMGHCFDPHKLPFAEKDNIILRRDREVRAWRIADEAFNTYSELAAAAQEYTDYKSRCLATYMKEEQEFS